MGGTTAPVCGSGSWPAWMASVSNPAGPPPELIVTSHTLPRCTGWSGQLGQCQPGGTTPGPPDPGPARTRLPRASPPRRVSRIREREGPVPAGRAEEVLPPGGGDEPFQPVVVRGHPDLAGLITRQEVVRPA